MARKNTSETAQETLRKVSPQEILALASKLFTAAKTHVANGKPTTQEDFAILNRARRQLQHHTPTSNSGN